MQFSMSRDEEMIFRELIALAGDLDQLAENLTRHHEERIQVAIDKQEGFIKDSPNVTRVAGYPMMVMNKQALLKDLDFILVRLETLVNYLRPSSPQSSSYVP